VFYVCDCCLHREEKFVGHLPPLENPLEIHRRYMHDDVFYNYVRWQGRFEEGYLIDWLGVRTRWPLIPVSLIKSLISWLLTIFYYLTQIRYSWDCIKDGGYYRFVPSRRLECERYDALLPAVTAGNALPILFRIAIRGMCDHGTHVSRRCDGS
jgi:hypothetical protein